MNDALQPNLVSQTWTLPEQSETKLPERADVVIIGGGIVGVSTAWFLAKQGVSVVLCEKGAIACEQSSRNWGWIRQQGRDTREIELTIDAMRIWETLEDDIGEDVGFAKGGCMFTARTDKHFQKFVDWLSVAKEYELDTRVLDRSEIGSLVKGAAVDWRGAMFTASDARAEPHKAAPAIARAAERAGAKIATQCAVRGIETSGGVVWGVVTEHGLIKTSTVLCAAGAWSSMFCRSLGIRLPQLRLRGTALRTAPGPDVLDGNLFSDLVGIRRRQDGGYTVAHGSVLDHSITPSTMRFSFSFLPALLHEIGSLRISIGSEFWEELRTPAKWDLDGPSPFEAQRVLNPSPNPKVIAGIRRNLSEAFPALGEIEFVESWAGMVETTPDVIPVIDQSNIPGFYLATGFSGHGFGIGPGAGKAAAQMLSGGTRSSNIRALTLSRFSDRTKIRPQTNI